MQHSKSIHSMQSCPMCFHIATDQRLGLNRPPYLFRALPTKAILYLFSLLKKTRVGILLSSISGAAIWCNVDTTATEFPRHSTSQKVDFSPQDKGLYFLCWKVTSVSSVCSSKRCRSILPTTTTPR